MRLRKDFYRRSDVRRVSRDLLGKRLCSNIDGRRCAVIITETEAYAGVADRASHAFGGRRTARTEAMYSAGGVAYVYLCYGIHHLFNVVTGPRDTPHAVLVRAGWPDEGVNTMLARRGRAKVDKRLLAGPGTVAQALGITTALSGRSLNGNSVWIEDAGLTVPVPEIKVGPRVGVDYAGEDAALPYRYCWVPRNPPSRRDTM